MEGLPFYRGQLVQDQLFDRFQYQNLTPGVDRIGRNSVCGQVLQQSLGAVFGPRKYQRSPNSSLFIGVVQILSAGYTVLILSVSLSSMAHVGAA
jgi:hypothetical protein